MYATGSISSISLSIGDCNNDIQLDIVATLPWNNTIIVLLGYGNGSFTNPIKYYTGSDPQSVAVGNFNKDTRLDIVVANYYSGDVIVFLGYGNGSFANQITYLTGSHPQFVAVGDVNNNSYLDIIVADELDKYVSVFLGYSSEGFVKQSMLTTDNNSRPQSLVIADFNNDDRMDIGVAYSGTHSIGIFLGYGNISFANEITYPTDQSPQSVAVGDFNNDTQLDIVVANYGSDNVGIFLGYGNGTFAKQMTYSTGSYSFPYAVAVGDFDNDNVLDIVVANYGNNNVGVLVGYGDDTFADIILFQMDYGSHPFFVVVADFNNDRKLDLAVANNGTENLYILIQTC